MSPLYYSPNGDEFATGLRYPESPDRAALQARSDQAKVELAADRHSLSGHEARLCALVSLSAAHINAGDGLAAYDTLVEGLDVVELLQSRVTPTARTATIVAALKANMAVHTHRTSSGPLTETLVGEMLGLLEQARAAEMGKPMYTSVVAAARLLVLLAIRDGNGQLKSRLSALDFRQ